VSYRYALKRLAASCPAMLSDITPRHIDSTVAQCGRTSHNTQLNHIKVFFNHAVGEGWLSASPAGRLRGVRVPEPPKGILTVPDTEALLHAAEERNPRLIPYLALGLFAGIRPGELSRISSDAVRGGYIILTGAETKTADARTIAIRPNLARWLEAYPFQGRVALLCKVRQQRAVSDLRKAAGLAAWPPDCMRHSFASYAYEQGRDAAHVASEMGHQGTHIFFKHYRALAHPGDGDKFFSIVPKLPTECQRDSKKPVK